MPERLTLALADQGKGIRHERRVVWRLGGELGVEFVRANARPTPTSN